MTSGRGRNVHLQKDGGKAEEWPGDATKVARRVNGTLEHAYTADVAMGKGSQTINAKREEVGRKLFEASAALGESAGLLKTYGSTCI